MRILPFLPFTFVLPYFYFYLFFFYIFFSRSYIFLSSLVKAKAFYIISYSILETHFYLVHFLSEKARERSLTSYPLTSDRANTVRSSLFVFSTRSLYIISRQALIVLEINFLPFIARRIFYRLCIIFYYIASNFVVNVWQSVLSWEISTNTLPVKN